MSLLIEQKQTTTQTMDNTSEMKMDPLLKTFCNNISEINSQNMVSIYTFIYIYT
jgi:hypothetical protein